MKHTAFLRYKNHPIKSVIIFEFFSLHFPFNIRISISVAVQNGFIDSDPRACQGGCSDTDEYSGVPQQPVTISSIYVHSRAPADTGTCTTGRTTCTITHAK